MGRKKWEANRSKKKGGILNGTEKMGSKQIKKKGGILKDSKKKRSSYKHGLGRKNWKQIDPKKNSHLEWDGKNGKQIDKKKGGILNGTEKMGRKELEEKTAI